jgi:hypothetical protein
LQVKLILALFLQSKVNRFVWAPLRTFGTTTGSPKRQSKASHSGLSALESFFFRGESAAFTQWWGLQHARKTSVKGLLSGSFSLDNRLFHHSFPPAAVDSFSWCPSRSADSAPTLVQFWRGTANRTGAWSGRRPRAATGLDVRALSCRGAAAGVHVQFRITTRILDPSIRS